jgi:hypothetical protein
MADLLPLIAIYAIFCIVWVAFAHWIAPAMIVAAYDTLQPSATPLIDASIDAVPLAAILHLGIVLFIRAIDRKHKAPPDTAEVDSRINVVLVVFSAVFLAISILAVAVPGGDYGSYVNQWNGVLAGRPWDSELYNAYGPLFNLLAPLLWISLLANKLLFAVAYLLYVIWLIKDFGAGRGLVALSWPVVVLWLINPFPWVVIAYFGHFDVLVAVACVAAVHGQMRGKDIFSGACLAIGILLKFLPIVILPFLVVDERRFRFRLFFSCVVLVISSFAISVLVWGSSTFSPLTFAATREPDLSIYNLLSHFRVLPNAAADWLEKLLLLTAGLGTFTWCVVRQTSPALSASLAVLVTLLFYRIGYIQYQLVLYLLISYWAVSEWDKLKRYTILESLLVCYFGLLAIIATCKWLGFEVYRHDPNLAVLPFLRIEHFTLVALLRFLAGFALLASLIQFSASTTRRPSAKSVVRETLAGTEGASTSDAGL